MFVVYLDIDFVVGYCWLLVFMSSFSVLSAFSFLLDGYNEHYTIVYTYNLLSMAWK